MKDLFYSAQSARDDPPDPPEPEPARSLPRKSCAGGLGGIDHHILCHSKHAYLLVFFRQDKPTQPLNGGTYANDFCIK